MEFLQMQLLLILTVLCSFNVAVALFDPEASFIRARDRVTANNIYKECCDQKWSDCCSKYQPNNSSEGVATPPPLPRSQKNPACKLAKARREESQALQAVTMLDIFIKIHEEYIKLKKLARCNVITKNSTRMSDLLTRILKLKNALEQNTFQCCYSHFANNHTQRKYEIARKFTEYLNVKKTNPHSRKSCGSYGHTQKITRLFSEALHRLGQQLKGLECLEALSTKRYLGFCEDVCIRRKTVQKCISQWL